MMRHLKASAFVAILAPRLKPSSVDAPRMWASSSVAC